MTKHLYLIDGSSYMYRGFFAMPRLSNSKGIPTNAILSVTNMLRKFIREKQPEYLAVAYDRKEETFRHVEYEDYKANRPGMPDELVQQIPFIKAIVDYMNIPGLEKAGFEADDIMATLAVRGVAEGYNITFVSADKDMMQLIDENINMYDPMRDRWFDEMAVIERFGVPPAKVADVLALMGDQSDNIPGVPGIGEKTAKNLIQEFGSIEALIENSSSIKQKKVKEKIDTFKEQALLSKKLVLLERNVPLDISIEELKLGEPKKEELILLFRELEFKNLLREFEGH
ncbi:MAG: hypothetical protein HZA77_11140 [Candidatus Schekmanbacteria bacterium]|nr:hypothetical protein [Candidatus Schekmanbacteria bacterium]